LKPLAKAAEIVQLQRGFQMDDVERAASDLLQRMRPQA
jgi:hypothetical protein